MYYGPEENRVSLRLLKVNRPGKCVWVFFFKVDIENSPDEETFLKLTKNDRKHMQIQIYWRYFKFNFYFEFGHGQRGFFLFF